MAIKYTAEQETELYDKYKEADDADMREMLVEKLATEWQNPKRSIIAKLSKMGIYIAKANQSKLTGKKPKTKEQLVADLEERLNMEEGDLAGLEKAPKMVILRILSFDVR